MDVEAFLTENKEKYEIIMHLQDLLNHISKETFQETIKYVEEKSDFFFKNRESAILFLWNFKIFTIYNFTQLEIILDVLLHFSTKLHEVNITDIDVITMMNNMIYDIYYLYSKNFISIKHIIQKSVQDSVFFVYFYPEIDEYDHEYAEKRKNSIFEGSDEHRIEEFLNTILSDINHHKQNREKAFNPSLLHKAIRDDDINNFQSILSQNNYSINYHFDYSFYERTLTENNTPSLIQVAAVYGSLQIFKFLLMQPNIEFDDKLICYAISGRNYEIIHLCEGKCSPKLALQFSINSHQHELTNYFIDNFDEKDIIQNPDSNKDDCDDNIYNMMNNELLSVALRNANYQILLPCLRKVTHKMDNFDKETGNCKSDVFLRVANHDFDLFKFLYSHKKEKMKFHVNYMIQLRMFDAFKYLLKGQNLYNFVGLFDSSLRNNYYFIFIIIDFLIDSGVVKNGIIYNEKIKKYLCDSLLIDSCCCYDEDLIEKISSVIEIDNPIDFIDALIEYTSTKFINSLFKRKLRFSPDSNEMHELLLDENLDEAAESLQSLNK